MAAAQRVQRGSAATLSAVFYGDGEVPLVPGVVTVAITSDWAQFATLTPVVTVDATNVCTCTLPASATAGLDLLTVVWTSPTLGTVTTYVEVVGGFYFELAELRAMPELSGPAGAGYTTDQLRAARLWIENTIDRATDTCFVARYARVVLNSTGNNQSGPLSTGRDGAFVESVGTTAASFTAYRPLTLPDMYVRRINAISVGGVPLSAGDLAALAVYPGGRIVRTNGGVWGWGYANVNVRYEVGHDDVCPGDLRSAALTAARWHVLSTAGQSSTNPRATNTVTEFGTSTWAAIDPDHPTGLPEVDAVIGAYVESLRPPMVA